MFLMSESIVEITFSKLSNFTEQQWRATQMRRQYRYFLFGGRRGVKKSYWLRWDGILQLLEWGAQGFKNVRMMLACEDYPTLVDRQISKLQTEAPLWLGEIKSTKIDGYAFYLHPEFGSGKLCFRSLDKPEKYQGSEWAAILIDEIGLQEEFVEPERRLFDILVSSLRWPGIKDSYLAVTGNPGGRGQKWVREFFIEKKLPLRRAAQAEKFAYLEGVREDDDILPQEYWDAIDGVGELLHRAWVGGDWNVDLASWIFKRGWFEIVNALPADVIKVVRYWDKAGTQGAGKYTAGVLIAKTRDNLFYICDALRGQWSANEREKNIKQTSELDRQEWGNRLSVWHEQEPGSGGKESAEATTRMLSGYDVHADKVTGDKNTRLAPLAAQAEAGNVKLLSGNWNAIFLDDIATVPLSLIRDVSDAAGGAFNKLLVPRGIGISFPD